MMFTASLVQLPLVLYILINVTVLLCIRVSKTSRVHERDALALWSRISRHIPSYRPRLCMHDQQVMIILDNVVVCQLVKCVIMWVLLVVFYSITSTAPATFLEMVMVIRFYLTTSVWSPQHFVVGPSRVNHAEKWQPAQRKTS